MLEPPAHILKEEETGEMAQQWGRVLVALGEDQGLILRMAHKHLHPQFQGITT